MTQGDLDEVLVMLRAVAMQPANSGKTLVQEQLEEMQLERGAGQRVFTLQQKDDHGFPYRDLMTVDLGEHDDTTGQPLFDWFPGQGFMHAQIESTLRVIEPFPSLLLMGELGPFSRATDTQEMEQPHLMLPIYSIAAVVFAHSDQQRYVQRAALTLATAFVRAVRLDETLGGLVSLIRPTGSIEPGGGGKYGKNATVMAARVHFDAHVVLPL